MARAIVAGFADGGIYALLAFGLVAVYRDSGVINLAHAEIGSAAVLIALSLGAGLWPMGAILTIAIAVTIAILFQLFVVSRMIEAPRSSVTVATIGLELLLVGLEIKLWHGPPKIPPLIGGLGPRLFGYYIAPSRMLALIASVIIGLALVGFTRRTSYGLATIAASQNRTAALLVGIPAPIISAVTWGLSGALAAISTLLAAPVFGVLVPGSGLTFLIRGLAAAVIGGVNRPIGPLIGGIAVGVIDSTLGYFFVHSRFPGMSTLVLMIVILAITIARPLEVAEPATI